MMYKYPILTKKRSSRSLLVPSFSFPFFPFFPPFFSFVQVMAIFSTFHSRRYGWHFAYDWPGLFGWLVALRRLS
ncbi:hypothetical protein L873DRAFT_217630 [Choiromyces venosus 120613-1]|uniref:Uncharacterized protein n=1 Tax=Choiromyces venosus 120613-1 TaxID=1336337 RepID=A0A3N4J1F0_9PEZI|nr:hypothetical protein L873DRAFT_217630 [Choiromyces venosus 120613-1]